MRIVSFFLFALLVLVSCNEDKQSSNSVRTIEKEATNPIGNTEITYSEKPEFESILEKAKVKGSILFFDENTRTYYSNNFDWAKKGFIPASTFKIPNSLIALELGIVENDSVLLRWDGTERAIRAWNQDLIFRKVFHYSCVPVYQEIARKVGVANMRSMVEKFEFGSMDIEDENLDLFWLDGESKITQIEQIQFLRKFYHSELPISERTGKIAKRMMTTKYKGYPLLAKTGRSMDGVSWYVGYILKNNKAIYFATNLEDIDSYKPNQRKMVTLKAFESIF